MRGFLLFIAILFLFSFRCGDDNTNCGKKTHCRAAWDGGESHVKYHEEKNDRCDSYGGCMRSKGGSCSEKKKYYK